MYCTKCGGLAPATARFCPGCGAAVADTVAGTSAEAPLPAQIPIPPAPGAGPAKTGSSRILIAIIGGVVILGLAVAAALFMAQRPPAPGTAPTSTPPGAAALPDAAAKPATVVAGFDWSGLSPEELHAARVALDAAIAREEQAAAGNSIAAPISNSPSVP